MSEVNKKTFYGWYLVFTAMLMLVVGTGLVNNSASQFIKPVGSALGISRGEFSLSMSCMTIAMIIFVPLSGRFYKKFNPKLVVLIGGILVAGSWAAMSIAATKYHFYGLGFLIGIGLSFTSTAASSMLISNWFVKKKGFAMGIVLLGTGVGAMIWNPVLSSWIISYGYQWTYKVSALISFVFMLPHFIMFRFKPSEIGSEAYGVEPTEVGKPKVERPGVLYKEAVKSWKFYAVCLIASCLPMCTMGVYTQLMPYFTDLGHSQTLAAGIISVISFCQAFAKPVCGWLNDRIGTRANLSIVLVLFFFGILGLQTFAEHEFIVYAAAVLFGFGMAAPTVLSPLVTISAFGQKDFVNIYGTVSAFFFVGPTVSPPLSGWIYDHFGSYQYAFTAYLVLIVLTFIIGQVLLRNSKYEGVKPTH